MSLADCTVMVVEDHEFQRRTMLQILGNLGTGALLEAADGASALALLTGGQRPDIVVCDLDMPGMDGIEFFRHVAQESIDTAIVIASGLDPSVLHAAETTARAYGVRVLGTVRKPLTARRLLEVVGLHRPVTPRAPAHGGHTRAWQQALERGGATVGLTPRVDLVSGRPVALQARALRSDGPTDTDAAAELALGASVGLAGEVADLVLAAACGALCEIDRVEPGLEATLVLPASACLDLKLADRLAARANAGGIDPRRLCVALPREPALPASPVQFDVLARLRMRGFGLGLDGFTAGDATIGGHMGLPLTEVTLDPDAVAGAARSADRADALEATIRALRDRGVRVVAAGCDTAGDRTRLVQAGCHRAQGAAVGSASTVLELVSWAGATAG